MLRRPLAALLLLLAAACAAPSPYAPKRASGARQSMRRWGRFRVATRMAPVIVRRDLSLGQVARLPGAGDSGLRTQGLTLIKHALATHTRFMTATDNASVSAWFEEVAVTISISSITVFIPREYQDGSCEYGTVLAHEWGHVRAASEQAAAASRDLMSALAGAAGLPSRAEPLKAASYAEAAAALKDLASRVIDPGYARFERELARAQVALDRPDPYDQIYKRCDRWK